MSRSIAHLAAAATCRGGPSPLRTRLLLAVATLALSVAGAEARTETPEEVDRILAFLEAQDCQVVRDAMGEKKLSMSGDNFVVEASCADEQSYTFTLDQNFEVIGKEVVDY